MCEDRRPLAGIFRVRVVSGNCSRDVRHDGIRSCSGTLRVSFGMQTLLRGMRGANFIALRAILEPLGAILGRSWGILGRSWGDLGRSWGDLGAPKRDWLGRGGEIFAHCVAPPGDFLRKSTSFKGLEIPTIYKRCSRELHNTRPVLRRGRRIEERCTSSTAVTL